MAKRSSLTRIQDRFSAITRNRRLSRFNRQLANHVNPTEDKPTAAFFIASSRLTGISLNSAFSYLTACGLQVAGYPVAYFACRAGMSRCVLGTNKDDPYRPPPCKACIAQSNRLFLHAPVTWFEAAQASSTASLSGILNELNLGDMSGFEYFIPGSDSVNDVIPLGSLVMPSLRWALRRHNLEDDEPTRYLLREYILSAWHIAGEFTRFLEKVQPSTVIVFNGILYPEATARWVAKRHGLRVVTHEVGFRPFSAFFTEGDATAYPIEIPDGFELSEEQNIRLAEILEKRFQGKFTMAGIRFWPEMRRLDESFSRKAKHFQQIVPIFTNVIYDTSQVHANKVFPDMFAWLDVMLELMRAYQETLFVIRAHPDELRPGKRSRENVRGWVKENHVNKLPNVIFVDSNDPLSSYELIERSKFISVYNSSIGLESSLLGKAVLCGGESRYTAHETAYFPSTIEEYRAIAEQFLTSQAPIVPPETFQVNARRVLYYQFFKASLPFGEYLEADKRPGYVRLKPVDWQQLKPENSPTIRTLIKGVFQGQPFVLEGD